MKRKHTVCFIVLLAVTVFVALLSPLIEMKETNGWTCAYTGSCRGHTLWFGLLRTGEWQQVSPIETWLEHRSRNVEHHWVRTQGTSRSLGGGRSYGHARAPAMFYFNHRLQAVFIETFSDQKILSFLEAVKSKPRSETRQMVDEVVTHIIENM